MQQFTEDCEDKEATLTERANNAEAEREVMKKSMQQLTEQLLAGHQDEKAKASRIFSALTPPHPPVPGNRWWMSTTLPLLPPSGWIVCFKVFSRTEKSCR